MTEWTPERIAELLALCEAASPGPWRADRHLGCKQVKANKDGGHRQAQWITEVCCTPGLTDETRDLANACLIAASRTALPAALAEIERLQARVGELELRKRIAERDAARGRPLTDSERLANLRRALGEDDPAR